MASKPAAAGGKRRSPDGGGPPSGDAVPAAPHEEEAVVSTAEEVTDAPMPPEAAAAVEDFLPSPAEMVLHDPQDQHEVAVVMDAHDVAMIVQRAQSSALKKWVYKLPDGKTGLTVHAVQDITQQMNWTGKARLGVLPETLEVERITEDIGNGPETLWVATVFAEDQVTGAKLPGSSIEPMMMKLKAGTAARWRKDGKAVPEDGRVFDVFSRTKAINKAYRNALAAFIPEELEQTIIAMYEKDPSRVERIQTDAEKRVEELPPALTDEKALAQVAAARAVYDEIRELGGGRGKIEMTPAHFNAYLTAAQHDHGRLDDFLGYLGQRKGEIAAKLGVAGEAS